MLKGFISERKENKVRLRVRERTSTQLEYEVKKDGRNVLQCGITDDAQVIQKAEMEGK